METAWAPTSIRPDVPRDTLHFSLPQDLGEPWLGGGHCQQASLWEEVEMAGVWNALWGPAAIAGLLLTGSVLQGLLRLLVLQREAADGPTVHKETRAASQQTAPRPGTQTSGLSVVCLREHRRQDALIPGRDPASHRALS